MGLHGTECRHDAQRLEGGVLVNGPGCAVSRSWALERARVGISAAGGPDSWWSSSVDGRRSFRRLDRVGSGDGAVLGAADDLVDARRVLRRDAERHGDAPVGCGEQ